VPGANRRRMRQWQHQSPLLHRAPVCIHMYVCMYVCRYVLLRPVVVMGTRSYLVGCSQILQGRGNISHRRSLNSPVILPVILVLAESIEMLIDSPTYYFTAKIDDVSPTQLKEALYKFSIPIQSNPRCHIYLSSTYLLLFARSSASSAKLPL